MKHCCPCEKYRKLRSKSNQRIGRVNAAGKKAAAKKKKEKESRGGDVSCPHCGFEKGHEPGQICKKLRQMNEEADSEMSNDKKDLEKASKQLKALERKLKEANKRVRSKSEPAPHREEATKLSDSDDEESYSVSDGETDADDDSDTGSRSSRGRKSKRGNLVQRKRHIGVARFTRVKKIVAEQPKVAHVNRYSELKSLMYSNLRESNYSPWGDSSDGSYTDMGLLSEPGHSEDGDYESSDDEKKVHPAEELEWDKMQALDLEIEMCYCGKESDRVIHKESQSVQDAEKCHGCDPNAQPIHDA